jgi:hypothetical protein
VPRLSGRFKWRIPGAAEFPDFPNQITGGNPGSFGTAHQWQLIHHDKVDARSFIKEIRVILYAKADVFCATIGQLQDVGFFSPDPGQP